jgi:hypothetical protein
MQVNFEEIASLDNLYLAYWLLEKGKDIPIQYSGLAKTWTKISCPSPFSLSEQ